MAHELIKVIVVLVRISIVMIKHNVQKQLGVGRFYFISHFYFTIPYQMKPGPKLNTEI